MARAIMLILRTLNSAPTLEQSLPRFQPNLRIAKSRGRNCRPPGILKKPWHLCGFTPISGGSVSFFFAIERWTVKLQSVRGPATRAKRCELLWTGPIERNVFARIRRPLKLVVERIDRTHHRFAPGHQLSWSGLRAGRIHELRIFSR